MKAKLTNISEIRKSLSVEVTSDEVDREIERFSLKYRRSARVPGFRTGKAPIRLIQQRMRDQILHDVSNNLIPQAINKELHDSNFEPIEAPSISDVSIDIGQALTFTANFEILPTVDPGNYQNITLRRTPFKLSDEAVTEALEQLRLRAARAEPIEGRGIDRNDIVAVSLERNILKQPAAEGTPTGTEPQKHDSVEVEVGSTANPPGFDEHLMGLEIGATKSFTLTYPENYTVKELSQAEVSYTLTVKTIHHKILPKLDDEFAKDLGKFESLDALREQVRFDLIKQGDRDADYRTREELLKQLAERVTGEVPEAFVNREVDRRVEQFVTELINKNIDPKRANIDWNAFRNEQRDNALETVRSSLVLDQIARRENLDISTSELEEGVSRQAELSGRTVSATRALLETEGDVKLLEAGLRREKAIGFIMSKAKIVNA